jgi:hypothetical protein
VDWQRFLIPLFTFVWWNRLFDYRTDLGRYRIEVIKVKGWRTALISNNGVRSTIQFMFWWD